MHYVFDLLQGLGLALAAGLSPFVAALAGGLLALADLGVDFDHTGFSFLESIPVLVLLAVLAVALAAARRSEPARVAAAVPALAAVLGALLAAGSLDDRSHTWWPGLLVGALAGAAAAVVAQRLLARVRGRLDAGTQATLPFYADAAGLVTAGLSVLFPPLALVALVLVGRLSVGGRRREGEKYAGLRILR